jgi:hypothetical protein
MTVVRFSRRSRAIEEWRSTLTDHERRNLNNPTVAWRKWMAATRVKKPKSRTAAVSATEHGRAQAIIDQQQARINELEEELTSARGSKAEKTRALEIENTGLRSEVEELKAAQPPLGLPAAIETLIYEAKHTVHYANILPEDVVFSKQDLDEIIARLQGLNKFLTKRRTAQKGKKGSKSAAKDALLDRINAKLVANGDPRRLTSLDVPLLGRTYALEGPDRPDGAPNIEGGMSQSEVVAFARKLGVD